MATPGNLARRQNLRAGVCSWHSLRRLVEAHRQDEKVYSFANNINTVDGGTHLSGFRSALTRTINAYAQSSGLAKNFKTSLTGDDVREGLVAVISVKLPQPQFEGQTKGKLNSDVKGPVESFLNDRLTEYLEQNPGVAKRIVGKALDAA